MNKGYAGENGYRNVRFHPSKHPPPQKAFLKTAQHQKFPKKSKKSYIFVQQNAN